MAWRARTEPAPAPSEVYAGVHAGPATYPVQPTSPQQPGTATEAAPSAVDRARKTLKNTHRHRNQIRPWRVLFYVSLLAMTGHLTSEWFPTIRLWVMLGIVGLGAVVGVTQWMRQKRAEFRYYAATAVAAATMWSVWAVKLGVWSGAGRFMPLAGLAAWVPLSWLWWERHRSRITTNTAELDTRTDPFTADWNSKIRGETKWELSAPEQIDGGSAYRVQLQPGETIEDAEQRRRWVASRLRGSRARLMFEPVPGEIPGHTDDESCIRLLVLNVDNPQYGDRVVFTGSTLERETGLYNHALYPDGPAKGRLYQVENGRPHRGSNSLISGTTGSGKSRGAALKGGEHILSGMFLLWFADGQQGVSAPDLMEFADWSGDNPDETMRMLRAAYKVMIYRARILKRVKWVDSHGNERTGLGGLSNMPREHRFPMIQVMIDEAQEILRDPLAVRLVKALLRMGNKVGIGVDLFTQVPLLNELGGESGDGGAQVIRDMAKSGNVIVYKAQNSTTGMIAITNGMAVDPQQLPDIKGMCYIAGHSSRPTPARTFYADEDEMFNILRHAPMVRLDEESAKAAGEDYASRTERRHARFSDEDDVQDLDTELAVLLGERLPGQAMPGELAERITVKQAVFEVVKAANGPIKRDQVDHELAQMGMSPSKSAVDQELRWWCDRGHMERPERGHYDLINREGAEVPAGA